MEAEAWKGYVSVIALSGTEISRLQPAPGDPARKVKEHLEALCGYPVPCQRLLHGGALLGDGCPLASLLLREPAAGGDGASASPAPVVSLTLVLLPFSSHAALLHAAENGHVAAVEMLVSRGAGEAHWAGALSSLEQEKEEDEEEEEEERRRAALLAAMPAVAEGRRPGPAMSALHCAAASGHESACRALCGLAPSAALRREMLLLASPEDQQRRGGEGFGTALHVAAGSGHCGTCRALLDMAQEKGDRVLMLSSEDCSYMKDWTPLHTAARLGSEAMCRVMLESVSSLEERVRLLMISSSGYTALHLAAERGHEEACGALLTSTQEVQEAWRRVVAAKDARGWTALHVAARAGHGLTCQVLLASAQSPDERLRVLLEGSSGAGTSGYTALHLAAERGLEDVCSTLIMAAGSEEGRRRVAMAQDDRGRGALEVARGSACWELLLSA